MQRASTCPEPPGAAGWGCRITLTGIWAQFAMFLQLTGRVPSLEHQALPGVVCHLGSVPRSHDLSPGAYHISQAILVHSAHLGKILNTSCQMKNSPRDFGSNHGNHLLNWIIVTLSESSLLLLPPNALKLDEFLNVVLLYLGAKSFLCAAETGPQIRMEADRRLGFFQG